MNCIFQYYLPFNGVGKNRSEHYPTKVPDYVKISSDQFKKYASIHQCDYMFSTEKFVNSLSNYFECLRVFLDPSFDKYDKVLYVDVDVIPKNMSKNVFDINITDVAGWNEDTNKHHIGQTKWKESSQLRNRFMHFGSHIVKSKSNNSKMRMINTGVVVWSLESRLKARRYFDDYNKWFSYKNCSIDKTLSWKQVGHSSHCLDQPYINAMWNKYNFDVLELGMEWNRFPTKDESYPCVFAHYVGSSKHLIKETKNDRY